MNKIKISKELFEGFETELLRENPSVERKGDLFYWFENGVYIGFRVRLTNFGGMIPQCQLSFILEDPRVSSLLSCIWGKRLTICQQPTFEWIFGYVLQEYKLGQTVDYYKYELIAGRGVWRFGEMKSEWDAKIKEIISVVKIHMPDFIKFVTNKSSIANFDYYDCSVTDYFLPKMALLNLIVGNIEDSLKCREQFKDYQSENYRKVGDFIGSMEYAVSNYKEKVKLMKPKGPDFT